MKSVPGSFLLLLLLPGRTLELQAFQQLLLKCRHSCSSHTCGPSGNQAGLRENFPRTDILEKRKDRRKRRERRTRREKRRRKKRGRE